MGKMGLRIPMIRRKIILSLNSHQTTKMMLKQIRKLKMMTQATLKKRKVDLGQDLKKDQDQERDLSQEESLAPDQERDPGLDQDEGQDQEHETEGDQDLFEDDHAHVRDLCHVGEIGTDLLEED